MATLTMAKRQQKIINNGFLDLLGEEKSQFHTIDLDAITGTLVEIAVEYATLARENLELSGHIATGALSDSIIPTNVTIFGKVYQVDINVSHYYKFVDKGVKGWADEKGGASPYQFKKTFPSKKMVTAIRKWVIREGLKGRGKENAKGTRRDRKRHKITDTSTQTAIMISQAIKRKGLRPSHFWTKTEDQIREKVKEEFGKALKIDIINNLIK